MSDQDLPQGLRDKLERMVRAQREEAPVKASHSSSTGFRVGGGGGEGKTKFPEGDPLEHN